MIPPKLDSARPPIFTAQMFIACMDFPQGACVAFFLVSFATCVALPQVSLATVLGYVSSDLFLRWSHREVEGSDESIIS